MTQSAKGWLVFATALGSMLAFLSVDLAHVGSWTEVLAPRFVGSILGHFAVLIGAFYGGKIIPTGTEASPS